MNTLTWKWGRFLSAGLATPGPSMPAPEPPEPMAPMPGSPEARPPRKYRALVFLLLLALAAGIWMVRRRQAAAEVQGGAAAPSAYRTGKVFSGFFEKTLRVSGSVSARNFAPIVAPQMRGREGGGGTSGGGDRGSGGSSGGSRGSSGGGGGSSPSQLILMKLATAGIPVQKGDTIAQFDSQWEIEHIDNHKAQVIQAQAVVDKRTAEVAIEAEAEAQLARTTKADNEKAKLDLRTAEVRSAIDAEKMKLAVEETAARVQQIAQEVELKKLSHQSDLKVLQIQVKQEQHHIDRHERNIERMAMKAPISGLVVMQSIFRSGQFGQVQEGDQVYPGSYFMQIVDLSSMVLNGTVNQADSHLLGLGQKATVRLEAYPGLALPAKLTALGAMASSGARGFRGGGGRELYVKQIPVRFAIEARDMRLLPDLSASADVRIRSNDKVLQVPREAVVEENGKAYAFVLRGEGREKKELQLGSSNNTHWVIVAGLSDGDEVLLDH